ncbi:major facilitator superfamily domain-containing protein [Dichotomopilus funicola]|uniref:Major facilitator superfamily domain-containing protein n=1 Tax=Dichotomopilus funicola TaxID=1934379 RepID=A0AAN6V5S8_9PEZI|nr:major facilitator superfamily domain-containing protein [Dichotomopilus funicola]
MPAVDRIDTSSERTPLLAGTPTPTISSRSPSPGNPITVSSTSETLAGEGYNDNDPTLSPSAAAASQLRALLRPRVIIVSLFLIFLLEIVIGVSVPPINAIMESIICRQVHPDLFPSPGQGHPPVVEPAIPTLPDIFSVVLPGGGLHRIRHFAGGVVLVDDPACKAPGVQGYLAMLRGWQSTFESIVGLIVTVPYGILSDRWGRRGVMALSMAGIVASYAFMYLVFYFEDIIPLWVSLLSAAFQLFGGGGTVLVAMIYTMLADVIPSEERAVVFFRITSVFLGSQMIAGPIGGALLDWSPWLPLLLSLFAGVLCNVLILAYPETVHVHARKRTGQEEDEEARDGYENWAKTLRARIASLWKKAGEGAMEAWDFIVTNQSVAFMLIALTFLVLGRYVSELLLQYATDRYGWSWSKASLVLTVRNGGSLFTLLVVLPAVSWFCIQRLGMDSVSKDLWLARWSGILYIIGSLIIACAVNGTLFSVGLAWYALGSGMLAMLRSLVNAVVEEHHVGILNSLIGFTEVLGMTFAGPALAESLSIGLERGGAWVGLPFFLSAVLFTISTVVVWVFRLPQNKRGLVGEVAV